MDGTVTEEAAGIVETAEIEEIDQRTGAADVSETTEVTETRISFREHPLFVQMEQQLAAGDNEGAAHNLQQLIELYPGEQTIRDLEVRAALRSTFSIADALPIRRGQPGALLRTALVFMALVAVCLTASVAFRAAHYYWVEIPAKEHQEEVNRERLWQSVEWRMAAGDRVGVREVLDELAEKLPGSERVAAAYVMLEEQESLARLYESAREREEEEDWAGALDLYQQLEEASPGYPDVRQGIARVERMIELEAEWQNAQSLVEAGDLQAVIRILADLRRHEPDFYADEVKAYLFNAYTTLAMEKLDGASGETGQMEEALEYLNLALELQPMRRDLIEERRLARLYVAGAAAYAQEDWEKVVEAWEPVYRTRADYQGGVVKTYLYEAYPRAGTELAAGARGAVEPLEQAIGYFDQALMQPDPDQWIIEERHLAIEYVAGREAYDDELWDEAIVHWGPIYVLRPTYQDGVLEEQLKVACAATEIDYEWCLP